MDNIITIPLVKLKCKYCLLFGTDLCQGTGSESLSKPDYFCPTIFQNFDKEKADKGDDEPLYVSHIDFKAIEEIAEHDRELFEKKSNDMEWLEGEQK